MSLETVENYDAFEEIEDIVTAGSKGSIACCRNQEVMIMQEKVVEVYCGFEDIEDIVTDGTKGSIGCCRDF